MKNILITGATGFVGKNFINKAQGQFDKIFILTRSVSKSRKIFANNEKIIAINSLCKIDEDEKIDIILNLAGEPIANKRWSQSQKEKLITSRLEIIEQIAKLTQKLKTKPKTIISASAIGFYGSQINSKEPLDEESKTYGGFTHELCQQIEEEILKIQDCRICITRFGIILGEGGALAKMLPAFKIGLGGKIASGQQIMSWVHIDDVIAAIDFLIASKKLSGIFNVTAPNSVTNKDFAKNLAKALNRPCFFDIPEFMVKILFGEMGQTLLAQGQNVYPKRLLDSGFRFQYPEIEASLKSVT